ncbi:hypothetical protein B0H10DRAFT_2218644 [Mycena sp. CBHHK59/15]|nr:hypothetical protein B0H10DRAFT_2218644 [Mycena sp. CBHHK59/15]
MFSPTRSSASSELTTSVRGLATFAFAATAAALSNVQEPKSPTSAGTITVKWPPDSSDTRVSSSLPPVHISHPRASSAPFTIALFSANPSYNGGFAIAHNVNPQNKATIVLPDVVPGPGYTISLISMSDTSDVLATSPSFSIALRCPCLPARRRVERGVAEWQRVVYQRPQHIRICNGPPLLRLRVDLASLSSAAPSIPQAASSLARPRAPSRRPHSPRPRALHLPARRRAARELSAGPPRV